MIKGAYSSILRHRKGSLRDLYNKDRLKMPFWTCSEEKAKFNWQAATNIFLGFPTFGSICSFSLCKAPNPGIMERMKQVFFVYFLTSIFSVSASDDQIDSFYKQRAILLAQYEYERSLDLMLLDPETCRIPVQKEDRTRVLKINIKQLEKGGFLKHCRELKFRGTRKILSRLAEQKKHLENILTFRSQGEGLQEEGGSPTATTPLPVVAEILEPLETPPPKKKETENFGTPPSSNFILSGYQGVPYFVHPYWDETFGLRHNGPGIKYYNSRNLPDGLTFSDSNSGIISGIPEKAGKFRPVIEVGSLGYYMKKEPLFKGSVSIEILPTPKYTVLNSGQRGRFDKISFLNGSAPLLSVTLMERGSVRALNSMRSGKYYFEVKVHNLGDNFNVTLSSDNLNSPESGSTFGLFSSLLYKVYSVSGSEQKKLKDNDVIMVAIDNNEQKLWYGVNGRWSGKTLNWTNAIPGGDLEPSVKFPEKFKLATQLWPGVTGNRGSSVTFNFGDHPWAHEAPKGFTGIPLSLNDFELPNMWNSNSASDFMAITETDVRSTSGGKSIFHNDLLGQSCESQQAYVLDDRGDAIFAMNPKSKGRWQFEIEAIGFAEKTVFGLAPVDFNTNSTVKLGSKGSGSIGISRKGIISVDGEMHETKAFDDNDRFTFDCDFSSGIVHIYVNGKHLLQTNLPKNLSGKWVIATNNASSKTRLYTLERDLKYPINGAEYWVWK